MGAAGCVAGPPPQYDDAGEGEEQDADETPWDAQHTPYDASADDASSTYVDTGHADTRRADTTVTDTKVADTMGTDTRPLDTGGADTRDAMADALPDGCAGKPNAYYCGANLSPAGNTGTLYQCVGGKISTSTVCSAGCDPTKNACYATGGSEITSSGARMTAAPATSACNFFAASTCGDCADTNCCTEETACFAVSECTLLWNCLSACPSGDATCRQNCANQRPTQVARVNAIYSCVNTKCSVACGADPCSKYPAPGNGEGCGSNLDPAASQNTLYFCNAHKTVNSLYCTGGCYAAPLGSPDYCITSDPCGSNPWDGVACGSNLTPQARQNDLYTCKAQKTVGSVYCVNGCYAAPPGEPDRCK